MATLFAGQELRLRRLINTNRCPWSRTESMLRGDSDYCTPEMLRFCREQRLDYIFGVAPTTALRRSVAAPEASSARYVARTPGTNRRR